MVCRQSLSHLPEPTEPTWRWKQYSPRNVRTNKAHYLMWKSKRRPSFEQNLRDGHHSNKIYRETEHQFTLTSQYNCVWELVAKEEIWAWEGRDDRGMEKTAHWGASNCVLLTKFYSDDQSQRIEIVKMWHPLGTQEVHIGFW